MPKKTLLATFAGICTTLVYCTPAAARSSLEIYSYGDAKLIKPIFEGLSAFASSGSWGSLARLAALFGLLAIGVGVMVSTTFEKEGSDVLSQLVRLVVIGTIVSGVTLGGGILTKDVTIVDAYTSDTYYVANVPAAAAYPAWIVNATAEGLANLFDKFFGSSVPYFNPREVGIDDLSLIPERLETLRFPICSGSGCSAYQKWRGKIKEFETNCVIPYFSRCEAGEVVDCCGIGGSNSNTSTIFRKYDVMLTNFFGMDHVANPADQCFLDPNEYVGDQSCRDLYNEIKDDWGGISSSFEDMALKEVIPDFQSTLAGTREDVFRAYLEDIVGITDLSDYGDISGFLLSTVIVNEMRMLSAPTNADYARAIAYATAGHTAMTWRIIGRQVMAYVEAAAYALSPILLVLSMIPFIGRSTWALFLALLAYVAFQLPLATLLTGLGVKKLITAYSMQIDPGMSFYHLYINLIRVGRQNGITTAYLMTAAPALSGVFALTIFKVNASSIAGGFQGGGTESSAARTSAYPALSRYYSSMDPELSQGGVSAESAYAHRKAMSPGQVAEIIGSQKTMYSSPSVGSAYRGFQSEMGILNREASVGALSTGRGVRAARQAYAKEQAARLGVDESVFSESLNKSAADTAFWAKGYEQFGRSGLFNLAMYRFIPEGREAVTSALRAGNPELADQASNFMRTGTGPEGIKNLFYEWTQGEAKTIGQDYLLARALGADKEAGSIRQSLTRLKRYANKWNMTGAFEGGLRSLEVENMSIGSDEEARRWENAAGLETGTLQKGDNVRVAGSLDLNTGKADATFTFDRSGKEIFRRNLAKGVFLSRDIARPLTEENKGEIGGFLSELYNNSHYNSESETGKYLREAATALEGIKERGQVTGEDLIGLHNIAEELEKSGFGAKSIINRLDYASGKSFLTKYGRTAAWTQTKERIEQMIKTTDNAAWARQMQDNLGQVENAIKDGQAVELTAHSDARTGDIATIEAEWGSEAVQFARSERIAKATGWQGSFAGHHIISGERTDLGGGMVHVKGVTDDGQVVDLTGASTKGRETIASAKTTGWQGLFAGYNFISGERTDLGGGMVHIKGVTDNGKIVDLMGTSADGEETIASELVKQGPSYNGALVMAEQGKVPEKVFHDEADSAIFASEYAKEVSKLYQGSMSKEDIDAAAQQVTGHLGINFFDVAGGSVAKSRTKTLENNEKSATDVITNAAMAIDMSDMTDSQKQAAYQELTATLMDMNIDRAKDLPEASVAMGKGKHPLGEIRNEDED